MESLLQFDRNLFFLINRILTNDFLDFLLPIWRMKFVWAPLYLFFIVYFLLEKPKRGWYAVVALLLCFAMADFISAGIIKEYFTRLRPCNDPEIMGRVRALVGCGSGYSFVSSHAANHFALASFLSSYFSHVKGSKIALYFWAGLVGYAQIYVGVHYPLDVICGALLGYLVGKLVFRVYSLKIQ